MQSVNEAQFSDITSGFAVFQTDIVPLTSIYTSLQSHKLDFNIQVLNSV